MSLGITLAEKGVIPDIFLRAGIRKLCRSRLASAPSNIEEYKRYFVEFLRKESIAIEQESANEQHYEVPAEFFSLVLGPHKKYSCCDWSMGAKSLGEAEETALLNVCDRAEIADGMKILDLGCGWGSLALWIAEHYPNSCITAVSNSNNQRKYIEKQMAERDLGNLSVVTADICEFNPQDRFDRIVSIEMFEHLRNYDRLFRKISSWLKPDGKVFVHVFCHREFPYVFETDGDDNWMGQHFFTGGLMPSVDLFKYFDTDLRVESIWELEGSNYKKTAEAWLKNLDQNRNNVRDLFSAVYGAKNADTWVNRWRLFFLACAELFGFNNGKEWSVSHYRFCKSELNGN